VYRLTTELPVAPWLVLSRSKVYSAGGDNVWIRSIPHAYCTVTWQKDRMPGRLAGLVQYPYPLPQGEGVKKEAR